MTGAVILAAGASRRFGSPKQLHRIDRRAVIERVLRAVSPVVDGPLVVVLGARAERIRASADLAGAVVVNAPDWEYGPGAALRAGAAAVGDVDALLVVLGDLPWLRTDACRRVLASPGDVVRAFDGDRPGHPVLLRGAEVARARVAPPAGLGALLGNAARAACAGLGVCDDLDFPPSGRVAMMDA